MHEGTSDSRPRAQPAPNVTAERLPAAIEALMLSSERPLSLSVIAEALGLDAEAPGRGAASAVRHAIECLNAAYDEQGHAFRIEQVAGGYRAMTRPEFGPMLASLRGAKEHHTLSRAAVETLAIVAYRQPITRADLEAIRGVACGEVLRTLLDKKLIDIAGRAEELGRPMLYGTTRRFLEVFGLASTKDLPNHQDFAPSAPVVEPKPAATTITPGAFE